MEESVTQLTVEDIHVSVMSYLLVFIVNWVSLTVLSYGTNKEMVGSLSSVL